MKVKIIQLSNGTELHTRDDGSKAYTLYNRLHREKGPAIEYADGSKLWYINGLLHREDGPAIEDSNGHKEWRLNGIRHRTDGPAIVRAFGEKFYYLNGKEITKEHFERLIKLKALW